MLPPPDENRVPEWVNHIPTVSDGPLLKSYLAALKADMTPTCIDGQTGYFSSRHGNYVVTLDVPNGCVCGSHTRPCKHQYRLQWSLILCPVISSTIPAKSSTSWTA